MSGPDEQQCLSGPASFNGSVHFHKPAAGTSLAAKKRKDHMADYFTNFSLLVPLPDEAAQKYALDLATAASSAQMGDEPSDSLPASIMEVIEDWQFETDAADRKSVV